MKRALVCYTIEQTLVEMGGMTMLNTVTQILNDKYHCTIMDCYDRPECLSHALGYLFGNSYTKIIKSINEKLEEFSYQKPISHFLEDLKA